MVWSVAALLLCAAPDVCAAPAKGTWLSRAYGAAGSAMNSLSLKKNLEKRHEELFGILDDSRDAADKGDKRKLDAAFEKVKKIPGKLMVDHFPILKAGVTVKEGLQNAKRRIKGLFGGSDETGVDPLAALAVSESERKDLGSWRLPATRAKIVSKPAKKFSLKEWGEAEQRARPHCYGVVSDATAAECETDSWGGKWRASKPVRAKASGGRDDRWDSGVGAGAQFKDCIDIYEASQPRKTALQFCCTGVLNDKKKNSMGWILNENVNLYVDTSKCDSAELRKDFTEKLKKEKPLEHDSDKARKEYEAALSRAVGDDPGASGSGDYRAALSDLEEKERQAREAAERRRIEEARLARQAEAEREAAERRRRYEQQREEEQQRETARRQAEINRKNQIQAIQGITQSIQNLSNAYLRSKGYSAPSRGGQGIGSRGFCEDCGNR